MRKINAIRENIVYNAKVVMEEQIQQRKQKPPFRRNATYTKAPVHKQSQPSDQKVLSFIPLGGPEEVTKNLYIYEYGNEILLVDCGIGFADETMLGVDLLLPDITYLLKTEKKIVGLLLSHGHEDHIGAVPFLLPQLHEKHGKFPVYASRLTAALTNEKLKEFRNDQLVQTVDIDGKNRVKVGTQFFATFIRITHSVPDSTNIFIETPIGNFYHGADYKIDLTPYDGKRSDFQAISKAGEKGVLCLLSDCLGVEHSGFSRTELSLGENIEQALEKCRGKFILTTYSSNVSRINQVIAAAEKHRRKVCFVGRSLIKVKDLAQKLELLHMQKGTEIQIDELKNYADTDIALLVAGSQGQENSALTRIADGEHKDVKLSPDDVVVFSSDPIPGNEISVYGLIDTIAKRGTKVFYSAGANNAYHVSGHGSSGDRMLIISLTKPKFHVPISGTYRHMLHYRELAEKMGYRKDEVFLVQNGQELLFTPSSMKRGRKIPMKNVYVDQVSGEELESFILRDREKLAKDGIVVIMAEISAEDGQLSDSFGIVTRGFSPKDSEFLETNLRKEINNKLSNKKERITNWVHMRRDIEKISSRYIDYKLRRQPLVMSVIIEV
jgi:ribonuclease J